MSDRWRLLFALVVVLAAIAVIYVGALRIAAARTVAEAEGIARDAAR